MTLLFIFIGYILIIACHHLLSLSKGVAQVDYLDQSSKFTIPANIYATTAFVKWLPPETQHRALIIFIGYVSWIYMPNTEAR